jgi:hypothetical protein
MQIKEGLVNFVTKIGDHLKKGLMKWLLGKVIPAGIELPETFDFMSIVMLVLQVLGLTWENVRARAVDLFGEKPVSYLEEAFDIFKLLIKKDFAGVWEYVKDRLSTLKEMVFDGITNIIVTEVIEAGIARLASIIGGPVGAFIRP